MIRSLSLFLFTLLAVTALAQEALEPAKVKIIDRSTRTLTLVVKGTEKTFGLNPQINFWGAKMNPLPPRVAVEHLRPGAEVAIRIGERGGKEVLTGLRLKEAVNSEGRKPVPTNLIPLPELGEKKYQGFVGGLYPDGKNERPAAHEKAGLALAKAVQPLDADGKPSPDGKIVLLSVGMSNTSQVFSAFKPLADADPQKNPKLVVVNGAISGMTAARIQDPNGPKGGAQYWPAVDRMLQKAQVTPAQVQAVWIKQADATPKSGFPAYAKQLQKELTRIVQLLPQRYPNIKLVYLSSRTYGGYATTGLNPEPYAYESGFSVKWLIERQLQGDAELNFDPLRGKRLAPWLSWGPYLWAAGPKKNTDGLSYAATDFRDDGTHPSAQGQRKVAERLLQFFRSDSTTRPWFVRR